MLLLNGEEGGGESDRVRALAIYPQLYRQGAKFGIGIGTTGEQGISDFLAKY